MRLQEDPSTPSTIINITSSSTLASTTTTTTESPSTPKTTLTAPTPTFTRPLYFAYGSNLSPTQMSTRCTNNPSSSIPLAIARLPRWRWLICQAGYANVLPPADLRAGGQLKADIPVAEDDDVYGVLYAMDEKDERVLDGYEGVDWAAPLAVEGEASVSPAIREREQGKGSYNKWVVEAEVVQWIGGDGGADTIPVLVYVDENRVELGPPKEEYIPRMNRAIRESVAIGFPGPWAEKVMRPSIPL
ncbi:hypothetical protein BO71DRAFT_401513, partial [Aspergillus ellipticus CBS 707.79]